MPHQCTECGRTFPDGSKEMLSGCPDCGGNKFQFDPSGDAEADAPDPDASPPDRPGGVADRVGRATAAVKGWMSGSDDDPTETPGSSSGATADQASVPDATNTADPATGVDGDPSGSTGATADATTTESTSDPDPATGDDDRAYGEWPNPDGVDTSGVGKGPEDRASPAEHQSADAAGDVEGPTRPDESGIDASEATEEDTAQATARSDVVSPEELPDDPPDSGTLGPRGGVPGGTADGEGSRAEPATSGADDPTDSTGGADDPTDSTGGADDPTDSTNGARPNSDSTPPEADDARVASEPAEERPDLEDLREELNDQFESIRIVEPGQYELNLMELYDREEYIISLQEDGRYVIEVPERWRDDEE